MVDYLLPLEGLMHDAKHNGWDFSLHGWILKIAMRDLICAFVLIVGWYCILDYSRLTDMIKPLRFNLIIPPNSQAYREIPYCISTTLMGTFFEVICLKLYGDGTIPESRWFTDVFANRTNLLVFCAWVFLMPTWRDGHFYFIHRGMHPWNTTWFPDIGHYLFKYGHAEHHESINFTAFSGISMHPIEGFIYETACFVPCFFYHHPILIWMVKLDLLYKAVLVHDGYSFPG